MSARVVLVAVAVVAVGSVAGGFAVVVGVGRVSTLLCRGAFCLVGIPPLVVGLSPRRVVCVPLLRLREVCPLGTRLGASLG